MMQAIVGSWWLTSWRRLTEGEPPFHPFGPDATGVLIYAPDGAMAVQMTAAHRPKIGGDDAIGGPVDARAAAYSTCLAYFGHWRIDGDSVVHEIDASLFPDWSGQAQVRPYTLGRDTLVLRTPPHTIAGRTVVNEMAWKRRGRSADAYEG